MEILFILIAANILLLFLFLKQKQKLELMEFMLTATILTLEGNAGGTKEIIDGRWDKELKNGEGAELMHASFLDKATRVSEHNMGLDYTEAITLFKKGKKAFGKNKKISALFAELSDKYERMNL